MTTRKTKQITYPPISPRTIQRRTERIYRLINQRKYPSCVVPMSVNF